MASNTPEVSIPTSGPTDPGAPVIQPQVNQRPPTPDPRSVAVSSKMPHIPGTITGSSNQLSSITAALGYNRFTPKSFASSYFVPSFVLMSLVISSIDRLMVNTYRFYQSNPDWHPLLSQLYYGIVFIVHSLRVRRAAQTITMPEADFLEWFESNWPFQSLPIAGPLKHFLQSITVASGPSSFYGNISPAAAPTWTQNFDDFYMPASNCCYAHLPPIPLIMDAINDMLNAGTRTNFDTQDPSHWTRFQLPFTHCFAAANTNPTQFGFAGVTDYVFLPGSAMPSWHNSASNLMFPARLDGAATPTMTTVAEFCRFGTDGTPHFTWFPSVIGMMQRHAQFLKDSTSLASISTVGLGAMLPIIQVCANPNVSLANPGNATVVRAVRAVAAQPAAPNVPATPGHAAGFRATRYTHFNVTATSKSDDLHLLAEQFSLLSCVNITFNGLAARGNLYQALPADNLIRFGPFWDLPDLKQHPQIDVYGQIVTFLTGAFHNDQRMNK